MNRQGETNKEAWSYRAYEYWINDLGVPSEVSRDMLKQPKRYLRRHIELLGDIIRKILKKRDIFDMSIDRVELEGDYFETELWLGEVAYKKFFSDSEKDEFPDCLLRYWTMGEIITAFASAGFIIEKLIEGPRFDEYKNIPGDFTLVASKLKIIK